MGAFFFWVICSGITLGQQPQSGSQPPGANNPAPPAAEVARYIQNYLNRFVLLNSAGIEAPALIGKRTTSPFAAVIEFSAPLKVGRDLTIDQRLCSATHLRRGDVVTHASCLSAGRSGQHSWIYILYYDDQGTKKHYNVTTYHFPERDFDTDKVVLQLPNDLANQWTPLLNSTAFPPPDEVWEDPENPINVSVWGYDALNLRPEVIQNIGGKTHGMVFNVRQKCRLHSVPTVIQWVDPSLTELKGEFKIDLGGKKRNITYLDSCDKAFLDGNQGALVTLPTRLDYVAGIYHNSISQGTYWQQLLKNLPQDAQKTFANRTELRKQHFYYRSYDGKTYEFFPYRAESEEQGLMSFVRPFQFLNSVFPEPDAEEEEPSVDRVRVRSAP